MKDTLRKQMFKFTKIIPLTLNFKQPKVNSNSSTVANQIKKKVKPKQRKLKKRLIVFQIYCAKNGLVMESCVKKPVVGVVSEWWQNDAMLR